MHKTLILSLLFTLLSGVAEARQTPWAYRIPIDEMTGKKDYNKETVRSAVDIEGTPWEALLSLFCESGSLTFSLWQYGDSDYHKSVELDSEGGIAALRMKFDNKEPFFTPWKASETNSDRVSLYDSFVPDLPENLPEINNIRKEIIKIRKNLIKGMIKHRRLWIGFEVKGTPFIAKFDLTGFSRELAKCSKTPDTN